MTEISKDRWKEAQLTGRTAGPGCQGNAGDAEKKDSKPGLLGGNVTTESNGDRGSRPFSSPSKFW